MFEDGDGDWGWGFGDWAQSPIPNPHIILILLNKIISRYLQIINIILLIYKNEGLFTFIIIRFLCN